MQRITVFVMASTAGKNLPLIVVGNFAAFEKISKSLTIQGRKAASKTFNSPKTEIILASLQNPWLPGNKKSNTIEAGVLVAQKREPNSVEDEPVLHNDNEQYDFAVKDTENIFFSHEEAIKKYFSSKTGVRSFTTL